MASDRVVSLSHHSMLIKKLKAAAKEVGVGGGGGGGVRFERFMTLEASSSLNGFLSPGERFSNPGPNKCLW